MSKQEIRKEIRRKINEMTEAQKVSQSLCVCEKILATQDWKDAKDVLLYYALPDEVNLSLLFDSALIQKKTIWLPVVDGDILKIRKYVEGKVSQSEQFHIFEPTIETEELTQDNYSRIDLAIVPGRAFSLNGNRMGRGKGYYDKFLALSSCATFGVAFSCQILDTVPMEEWDKKMDKVIISD
ncbi:MAG: 5-formyltetrahydrofolate cyclo-ligase [Bacteroidales bacterium]|nr:5-formyltetrahydrofolate cyclo-ligase [Bacteroidales bacterium]